MAWNLELAVLPGWIFQQINWKGKRLWMSRKLTTLLRRNNGCLSLSNLTKNRKKSLWFTNVSRTYKLSINLITWQQKQTKILLNPNKLQSLRLRLKFPSQLQLLSMNNLTKTFHLSRHPNQCVTFTRRKLLFLIR